MSNPRASLKFVQPGLVVVKVLYKKMVFEFQLQKNFNLRELKDAVNLGGNMGAPNSFHLEYEDWDKQEWQWSLVFDDKDLLEYFRVHLNHGEDEALKFRVMESHC